jgi:glycosyltransferase involved in cell wall biosynthesis
VVDGENGYLVKYDDVQGLAQAALKLAKDKGLCEVMGALNRKKVEQEFSLISHARSIEGVYSRILSDPFCKAR